MDIAPLVYQYELLHLTIPIARLSQLFLRARYFSLHIVVSPSNVVRLRRMNKKVLAISVLIFFFC